jgi:hypothetical protein
MSRGGGGGALSSPLGERSEARKIGRAWSLGPGAFWESTVLEMAMVPMDGAGSTMGRH